MATRHAQLNWKSDIFGLRIDTFQGRSFPDCWSRGVKVSTLFVVLSWSRGGLLDIEEGENNENNALNDKFSCLLSHLRHSISLQLRDSSLGPSQSLPPTSGGGFVQVRSLTCSPVPHHLSQFVQSPHSLHPPSPGEPGSRNALKEEERVKRIQ